MKKLFVLICFTLFLAQPIFSAGYGSSDTSSSGSSGKDKKADPFANVYMLIDLEKFTEAHNALKLLNVPTKQADKFNLLGFTARKSGDLETAKSYYLRALEINPKHVRALEYQGELFLQLGKVADAKQNLEKIEVRGGFEALGEPPGAKMPQRADWDVLGAPSGGLLEHILAPRWAKLDPRWRHVGQLGAKMCPSWRTWNLLGALLGASW